MHKKTDRSTDFGGDQTICNRTAATVFAAFVNFNDIKPELCRRRLRALPHLLAEKLVRTILRGDDANRCRARCARKGKTGDNR